MESLREFIGSSSGLAPARQGLGLGWVISALTGLAILLGAREAAASCEEDSWTEDHGYSAGCDELTGGDAANKCRDCWMNTNCEISCGSFYCCA